MTRTPTFAVALAAVTLFAGASPGDAAAARRKPVNTAPPAIQGTAEVGQTLTAQAGTWSSPTPVSYGYSWRRCDSAGGGCATIDGATSATYVAGSADAGATLRVRVTATNTDGSTSALSPPTDVVSDPSGSAPVNTAPPTIAGAAQQGQTLSADPGTWSGTAPISYAYQWRRCDSSGAACGDIGAATAQSYLVTSTDVGSTLRVRVTASNSTGSAAAGSAQTSPVAAAPTTSSTGFRGPSISGAGTAPTGSKPESKLWWNDGAWWASMWAGSGLGFHIFRLNPATQTWSDTGVRLDDRSGTRADVLWDGSHLYVASHVFSTCGCSTSATGYPSRLYRFSYDPIGRSYTLDTGFPIQINNTRSETLIVDRDSTGTLWATWAQDNRVMVTHTQNGDDRSWRAPYVLPATGASNLNSDDIATLVSFEGNKVGVMWSNQTDSAVYWAHHLDGAADTSWTSETPIRSSLIADDHLNLRSLQADANGQVFAVTKTSLNDASNSSSSAPLVLLLSRRSATGWASRTVWQNADGVTRPMLVIDESNGVLHAFATSSESGGTILEKTSPTSSIAFPTGAGRTFIKDPGGSLLNNATASKQNATRQTGIVVLAAPDSSGFYWHNHEALP